jgi:hypothetical protein
MQMKVPFYATYDKLINEPKSVGTVPSQEGASVPKDVYVKDGCHLGHPYRRMLARRMGSP